jgi:hypothetical protein
LDPVEAIGVYREAGYDFIAITDHHRVGHLWQDDDFLILPGVEWDTGDVRNAPVYHILGIGMTRDTVDFYHGAPYEGAPLGNTRSGIIVEGKYGRKRYLPILKQSLMQSGGNHGIPAQGELLCQPGTEIL